MGAIVGGVVGGVALLVILAAIAFLFRRRRRRVQTAPELQGEYGYVEAKGSALEGSKYPHELGGESGYVEVPSEEIPHELDASVPGR